MQAKLIRSVARLYPIEMGKGWIASLLKDRNIPDGELVQTSEGVRLRTRPDYLFKHAYLFREFEPVITAVFKRVVEPGDVCFDVGASFGFYTCLFAMRGARVYAFEPMPGTVFEKKCLRAIAEFCESRTNKHRGKSSADAPLSEKP